MCHVYINRDGVCWRLDSRKRRSKQAKRLATGKFLASDGDVGCFGG